MKKIFKITPLILILVIINIQDTYAENINENIIKQEFEKNIVTEKNTAPEFWGNSNDYLNKLIYCTKFKSSINDPVCQSLSPTKTIQSFIDKNVQKVNEQISKTTSDIKQNLQKNTNNNDTYNKNIVNKTGNNIAINNQTQTEKKQIIKEKNTTTKKYTQNENNIDNKSIQKKLIDTGPNIYVLIILIFLSNLILSKIWQVKYSIIKRK